MRALLPALPPPKRGRVLGPRERPAALHRRRAHPGTDAQIFAYPESRPCSVAKSTLYQESLEGLQERVPRRPDLRERRPGDLRPRSRVLAPPRRGRRPRESPNAHGSTRFDRRVSRRGEGVDRSRDCDPAGSTQKEVRTLADAEHVKRENGR